MQRESMIDLQHGTSLLEIGANAMKWRVLLEQDEETGDWAVWCPELPGCASAGETEEEALANIREAIELYLQPDPLKLSPEVITREVTV
jgi:predicted RNase H-like HicB family nuclease